MPSITKMDTGSWGASMKAYSLLNQLVISDMVNLEELSTTCSCGEGIADEFMFPSLKDLTIKECHKLRVVRTPRALAPLKSLNLDRFQECLSSLGDLTSLQSLRLASFQSIFKPYQNIWVVLCLTRN